MRIPRIRVLRHWSRTKTSKRGCWLFMIEPRWPCFVFENETWADDFTFIRPTENSDTLEIHLEHFSREAPRGGSVRESIFFVDLFALMQWIRKC